MTTTQTMTTLPTSNPQTTVVKPQTSVASDQVEELEDTHGEEDELPIATTTQPPVKRARGRPRKSVNATTTTTSATKPKVSESPLRAEVKPKMTTEVKQEATPKTILGSEFLHKLSFIKLNPTPAGLEDFMAEVKEAFVPLKPEDFNVLICAIEHELERTFVALTEAAGMNADIMTYRRFADKGYKRTRKDIQTVVLHRYVWYRIQQMSNDDDQYTTANIFMNVVMF